MASSGNDVLSGDYLGTVNNESLKFKAGDANWMTLTTNGKLSLNDGNDGVSNTNRTSKEDI